MLRADIGKPFGKFGGGFTFLDFRFVSADNIARIEPLFGFHKRNARFRFAADDSVLNGRGAAIFRQKRSVNIDYAEFTDVENVLCKNLSVCADNHNIRVEFHQFFRPAVTDFFILQNGDSVFFSNDLGRRRRYYRFSSDGSVRLTYDRDYFVYTRFYYAFERFYGKFGRAEINYLHFTRHPLNYSLYLRTEYRQDDRFRGKWRER